MARNSKISPEIIDKLTLVQDFIDDLYSGTQHHKARIAFTANTLTDTIQELKAIREI